jgi:hypothetical protein
LIRNIGKLVNQWQQQCLVELSKAHAVFFNIFTYLKFHHVKVVGVGTTFQTTIVGIGKFVKKSDVLSIEEECKFLPQEICQLTSPFGLHFKFKYFYMCNFFIRWCSKFRNVDFDEFHLFILPTSVILRFCQGVSKNWWIDVTCCFSINIALLWIFRLLMLLKVTSRFLITILSSSLLTKLATSIFYALGLSGDL